MNIPHISLVQVHGSRKYIPSLCPPLGILSLASYIRSQMDVKVQIIDQGIEQYTSDKLVDVLEKFNTNIVGLSVMTFDAYLLRPMVELIRTKLPDVLIIVGGPHASAMREKVLHECDAHFVVPGEGETSLLSLIRQYAGEQRYESINGLIWRNYSGEIVQNNGPLEQIQHLDVLPYPAYDLVNTSAYWDIHGFPLIPPKRKYIPLTFSRGCPYQCTYCHGIFGKKVRRQSYKKAVDTVQYFVDTFGITDIDIWDDIFNLSKDYVIQFCDEMLQRNIRINIAFPNGLRTDRLDKESIAALAAIGTNYVAVALESGSPRIQDLIKKRLDIERFLENVEYMSATKIFVSVYSMLGFPTETEEELHKTMEVACRSKAHAAFFFRMCPFPGSEVYNYLESTQPEKLGLFSANMIRYQQVPVNFSSVDDETFNRLHKLMYKKFYVDPDRIYRILRTHPKPYKLYYYIIDFINKGLLSNRFERLADTYWRLLRRSW